MKYCSQHFGIHSYICVLNKFVIVSQISAITWIIGSLIMGINIYYLASGFIGLLLHSHLKLGLVIFCGILGFSCMALYVSAIAYLVFRKNKEASHLLALTTPGAHQLANESGNSTSTMYCLPREDIVSMQLPQRNTGDLD